MNRYLAPFGALAIVFFCLTNLTFAKGNDWSSDFGDHVKKLEPNYLLRRLKINIEVFIFDSTGTKLISVLPVNTELEPGSKATNIKSSFSVAEKGIKTIALSTLWEISDDNILKYTIKQFESLPPPNSNSADTAQPSKLIREESKSLENLNSVNWVTEQTKDRRVVVRMTPNVDSTPHRGAVDKITIGGDRGSFTVFDNQGNLWGSNIRFGGVLAGMISYRGALVFSLYPFKGSKPMGFAQGKLVELDVTDELKITAKNEEHIVPGEGRFQVHGRYYPDVKSERPNSQNSFGQMSFEGLPKELRK